MSEGGEGRPIKPQEEATGSKHQRKVSRRRFLRGVAAAATATATVASQRLSPLPLRVEPIGQKGVADRNSGENRRGKESREIKGEPRIRVIDLFAGSLEAYIRSTVGERLPQLPLGISEATTIEEATEELGLKDADLSSLPDLRTAVYPTGDEKLALAHLSLFLMAHYRDHGASVLRVIEGVSSKLGIESSVGKTSAASVFRLEEVRLDPLGNPELMIRTDRRKLREIVSSSDEAVISLSFQMGEHSVKYNLYGKERPSDELLQRTSQHGEKIYLTGEDGKQKEISRATYSRLLAEEAATRILVLPEERRDFIIFDGYSTYPSGEYGRVFFNLYEMVQLAAEFPGKMFVVAGGNAPIFSEEAVPDIRRARRELEERGLWPDNLIVVGAVAYEQGRRAVGSHGCDIYVDDKTLEKFGVLTASSYATPVISSLVRTLVAQGVKDPLQVKKKLLGLSVDWRGEVMNADEEEEVLVLEWDRVEEALKSH
jgi:hypothetical protein